MGLTAAARTGQEAKRWVHMTNFIRVLNKRCMYKIDKGGPKIVLNGITDKYTKDGVTMCIKK